MRFSNRRPRAALAAAALATAVILPVAIAAQESARPPWRSPLVTHETPGHAVAVDVDITGARELWLIVTDGGNGYGCDWADWAEPRLVGPAGEKRLTELEWKEATADWGEVRIGRNAGGGALRIAGKDVAYGIGTHANSVIRYEVPAGYGRFVARAGLDNGGTDQGDGGASSVTFEVHAARPDLARVFERRGGAGAGGGGATHDPARAVSQLDVFDGLEATLFASEPMVLSPSNIDIDYLGRVWVCEVVNYRGNNGRRPEGDRILILEDTDGDGAADSSKVFYQGRDIDSALGIGVFGNTVIVSCSPNVFLFHDDNGDDIPDRRETLFTKTGAAQHDHSAHAFVFGPDGKLYWNFGNTGGAVHDRQGKVIVDRAGNEVVDDGKPYFGGMVFRCDADGGNFEVLGHNFRNNYEVAVDAFGSMWQSDNDDDGNRGVRINWILEFGNYGYRDEKTGAGWGQRRTGMEAEIPLRHWHLNDPGVVPNLLQTGGGSPTGIVVYEGDLLPPRLRNQVIHCDAGPNIVRAYPVTADGAGYRAEIADVLRGARNDWFRPADVCVAPDGSLFVADWYDPGVGGHAMRDLDRGRIFRVAPPGHRYRAPKHDFASAAGAAAALSSPAVSVRHLAWKALRGIGAGARPALEALWKGGDARARARALWLLSKLDESGPESVERALRDEDADIRIAGLRAGRQIGMELRPQLARLARDASPAVRREVAVTLRDIGIDGSADTWAELASRHDGSDRWYLEALGIAAAKGWDACLDAWLARAGDGWQEGRAGRDIVWRSRAARTPGLLADLILDGSLPEAELPRSLRAFDFLDGPERQAALVRIAFDGGPASTEARRFAQREAIGRLRDFDVSRDPAHKAAVEKLLDASRGTVEYVEMVGRFGLADRFPALRDLACAEPESPAGIAAARLLLERGKGELLAAAAAAEDRAIALGAIGALGNAADARAVPVLSPIAAGAAVDIERRRLAARGLTTTRNGARELLRLAEADAIDEPVRAAAAFLLHRAAWREARADVDRLFPLPGGKDDEPLPSIERLLDLRGDARRGKEVFEKPDLCNHCHVVAGQGKTVGPDLSEIGDKLSAEALLESILFPSAGISHSFETWLAVLADGDAVTGTLVSETPEEVTLRGADALSRTLPRSRIVTLVRQDVSLMPADLQKLMTAQDLADVLAYLRRLRKER